MSCKALVILDADFSNCKLYTTTFEDGINYVESDGNAYVLTDIRETSGNAYNVEYCVALTHDTNSFDGNIFSSRYFIYPRLYKNSSNVKYARSRLKSGSNDTNVPFNWVMGKYYVIKTVDGYFSIENEEGVTELASTQINTGSAFSENNVFGIFCRGSAVSTTSSHFKGRMKYIKIYDQDTDTLLYNFIPFKDSNNVIGLKDTVNNIFYPSSSETPFTGGTE